MSERTDKDEEEEGDEESECSSKEQVQTETVKHGLRECYKYLLALT